MRSDQEAAAGGEAAPEAAEASWRERAVSRSLSAARSRAERRVQRFVDAAFSLIDEKGTTDFTIQEVVDRSKQSLRGFYRYFDGKDQLLLVLFEENVRETLDDLRASVDAETDPLKRLRAFVVRLHEWCEPRETRRKRGSHNRRPISEFTVQLALSHPARLRQAIAPISRILLDLLEEAAAKGAVKVADPRRAAILIQQTVMYSWFGNRLLTDPALRVTAEQTWEFLHRGLRG